MPTPHPQQAIGVFDSGLGGLTVAAALARALPEESLVYLGDTARVPYGTKSPATVVRYCRGNVAFLKEQGVKLVVLACNTASAHALGGLAEGSTTPLLGVIRPGARAAVEASKGGPIAVLGTPATVRSNAYLHAIHELAPRRSVVQLACPLFVPLAEEGWLQHPVTEAVIREYLEPLRGSGVDTVILGCTHYPLLRPAIEAVVQELLEAPVEIVDSAAAVASEAAALLDRNHLRGAGGGAHRFFVTDAPETAELVGARFWGRAVGSPLRLEHVDLLVEPS